MEISHFYLLLIYKQQVLFTSFHFHILDAPALEKVIRKMSKFLDENSELDSGLGLGLGFYFDSDESDW